MSATPPSNSLPRRPVFCYLSLVEPRLNRDPWVARHASAFDLFDPGTRLIRPGLSRRNRSAFAVRSSRPSRRPGVTRGRATARRRGRTASGSASAGTTRTRTGRRSPRVRGPADRPHRPGQQPDPSEGHWPDAHTRAAPGSSPTATSTDSSATGSHRERSTTARPGRRSIAVTPAFTDGSARRRLSSCASRPRSRTGRRRTSRT